MSEARLLYYSSKVLLQKRLPLSTKAVSSSSAPGSRHVHHYEAIEAVAKGVQPYLSLYLEAISDSTDDDEPRLVPSLEKTSPRLSEDPSVISNSPTTQPISTVQEKAITVAPKRKTSSPDTEPKSKPEQTGHGSRAMEDALPKAEGRVLRSWSDDDIGAVDYKNAPDYDPDQDDTEYGTTS